VATVPPVTGANVGERAQQLIDQGLAFMKTQQQADGDFAPPQAPPGLSAIALKAFVQDPAYSTTKDDFLKKGYAKLISFQVGSGGIFKDMLATYNTAIAVSALAAANDPSFKPELDKAVGYLRGMQWTDTITGPHGESIKDPKKASFEGGFGYGRHSRPDLSNTQFALDALHDAGVKPDDPAFQEALKFVTRCQNFSETNDQPWAGNDGGFVYSAGDAGDSEAGSYTAPNGQKMWRSYGSMTYAGFKSLIYAGLGPQDARVKAALGWIKRHWTLDENPGLRDNDPTQALHGLYYYFHAMARALAAYGQPVLVDDTATPHDWRVEMTAKIASLQRPDGSWAGEKRWMEDNPVLSTAYNVLALEEIVQDLKVHPAK
jgi:squalene-hopene/tetraprenyl-beta-curcumene cyclase